MNEMGTKMACGVCGAQVVVTRGGEGQLACHGADMDVLAGSAQGGVRPTGDQGLAADDPFYD